MKQQSMSGTRALPFTYEAWRDIDIDSMRELMYVQITLQSLPAVKRKIVNQ